MSNIEVDSSDEEYHPRGTKNRNSWPTKPLHFSAKYIGEPNPFALASQSSPKKASKRGSKMKASGNNSKYNTGRWSNDEHKLFLEAIDLYGRDWKKVQDHVGTRTSTQARSHAQKVLPHPNTLEANVQSHNSSSTTMTKGSPPSVKNSQMKEWKPEGSVESDDGASEFQIFKVEKVKKQIVGRDRVNSENNVFKFNIVTSEFVDDNERIHRANNRKLSLNNDAPNYKNDLVGSPIKETIKEHFNEDEDEEAKDHFPVPQMEKQKTFEPKHFEEFENDSLFSLHKKEQEMNLDSIAQPDNDFPMEIDDGWAPWNSLQIMNEWKPSQRSADKSMDNNNEFHFGMDIDMDDNIGLHPTLNNELV